MSETKCVLIVGAGDLQVPLIIAAKELGINVIASDQNPEAIGFQYSDFNIIANTLDPQDTLQAVKYFVAKHGIIDGVLTAGTDASLTVAVVAEEFSLPGHTVPAAINATNKWQMRECLFNAGVSIPLYYKFSTLEELTYHFSKFSKAVIKPISNMGARGTSLVNKQEELEQAFQLVEEYSRENEFLIEEYIEADELSIDALVYDDEIVITGIADRIIEYSPYFVETGHIIPSQISQERLDIAVETFKQGVRALGLTHGAAKGDIKIGDKQAWVIEIAARLSGGFMSSHTYPFSSGVSLHKLMVKLALGEKLEKIQPTKNFISVERAIITAPGIIQEIVIPDDIMEQEFITHVSFRAKVGDEVVRPKNNLNKLGNIIATAPTKEQALRAVNKAISSIKIEIMPHQDRDLIISESLKKAKPRLSGACNVCRSCDGVWCRGMIPGVGGVGSGEAFTQTYLRYRDIKLTPHYIHEVKSASAAIEMFGIPCSMPIFSAPIGGAKINLNGYLSELELQRAFAKGCSLAGTLSFLADPAPSNDYYYTLQAALENYGRAVPIFKPRANLDDIKLRLRHAQEAGVVAVGMDIDGVGLRTFAIQGQSSCTKSFEELKELIFSQNLPFVVKGVMSVQDALHAYKAGATHIVVSNHGGRILDASPLPIDVLPDIKEALEDRIPILIDGAIRSASDVAKALILGADAVLIGRPIMIHTIGGGAEAVYSYLQNMKNQLEMLMTLLGVSTIDELKNEKHILKDLDNRTI